MKFKSTSGREYSIDIRPSKWKRKEEGTGRGIFQSQVGAILAKNFSDDFVLEEFPLPGEGLYIDFFLPRNMIGVEVQGTQHHQYNKFFHKDRNALLEQQKRDRRKKAWCELNNIRLVVIEYDEPEDIILAKIKPPVEG